MQVQQQVRRRSAAIIVVLVALAAMATAVPGTASAAPPTTTASKPCPAGATFDKATKQCVVAPTYSCPQGMTLEGTTCWRPITLVCSPGTTLEGETCVAAAVPGCPSGGSLDGETCVTAPTRSCPAGTVRREDVCVTPATSATCREGYAYNGATGFCETELTCGFLTVECEGYFPGEPPACPEGTIRTATRFEGYPAFRNYSTCAAPPLTATCPSGTTYDTGLGGCRPDVPTTPTCRDGFTYDELAGFCTKPAGFASECPEGTGFGASPSGQGLCLDQPTGLACPEGYVVEGTGCAVPTLSSCALGTYDAGQDRCESAASATCAAGTFDPVDGRCEAAATPSCDVGELNGATGRCETPATPVCPTGFTLSTASPPVCQAPVKAGGGKPPRP